MAEDVFRKGSPTAPPGYFRWEAAGLAWLGAAADGAAVGRYEFTAANGDKVYAEFSGIATPTAIPGVLYIE